MTVRVIHGANDVRLPLVGKTIAEVRRCCRDVLNLKGQCIALVRGIEASDDSFLQEDDQLEFVAPNGMKGGNKDYWSESEVIAFFGADCVESMVEAGLEFRQRPVLTEQEVRHWMTWRAGLPCPQSDLPNIEVCVENESVIFNGTRFQLDMELAAILKCIVDGKGEIRTQRFMIESYPGILHGKLNRLITRLKKHLSGVGEFIGNCPGKGYRLTSGGAHRPVSRT